MSGYASLPGLPEEDTVTPRLQQLGYTTLQIWRLESQGQDAGVSSTAVSLVTSMNVFHVPRLW